MNAAQAPQMDQVGKSALESFLQNNLWPLAVVGVVVLGLLAWLYYADWRKGRSYRRYLECKRRKWLQSRQQAELRHSLPDALPLSVGQSSQGREDIRTTQAAAGEGRFQGG